MRQLIDKYKIGKYNKILYTNVVNRFKESSDKIQKDFVRWTLMKKGVLKWC